MDHFPSVSTPFILKHRNDLTSTMPHTRITEKERLELIEILRNNVLFSSLSPSQLDGVSERARSVALKTGEILFEQQWPAMEFFMLNQGRMKLALISAAGNEKIIDLISPGQCFAEAVMFSRQKVYPVNATAIIDSHVWRINSEHYSSILHQSTDACFALLAQMSRRLHGHVAEVDRLALHNATFRLVTYLLDQIPSTHIGASRVILDIPKQVMASRLSITPETLSRTFLSLSKDDLISIRENAVTLKDVGRLRRFINGEAEY